jgi:leucyl-tRNA---protein transferase
MFAKAIAPNGLTPAQLDDYLEQGWFRMGQSIFTTHFIHFKSEMYSTLWLRVSLPDFITDTTQVKLAKKNNCFYSPISQATITEEKEKLYSRYRATLPFSPSQSLHDLLFGKLDSKSIYQTYEAAIYDGDKLIAIGFFDLGETSAAGIICIYDPMYKKYSLGKYLIYLKINYCKALGLRYFYPGYFVPGYSHFDYKLSIGRNALAFLRLESMRWLAIDTYLPTGTPINVMHANLLEVHRYLELSHINSAVVNYEFFDANLIPDLREAELLDFPVFLYSPTASTKGILLILVFDIRDHLFHLFACAPVWQAENVNPDRSFYSTYFLKIFQCVHSSRSAQEAALMFKKSIGV